MNKKAIGCAALAATVLFSFSSCDFNIEEAINKALEESGLTFTEASGVITVKDAAGNEFSFNAKWPEHELTKGLPKPSVGTIGMITVSAAKVTVDVNGITADQARAYVDELKAYGCEIGAETNETGKDEGFVFTGSSDKGLKVTVEFAKDYLTLICEKI